VRLDPKQSLIEESTVYFPKIEQKLNEAI